ncbi:MAG: response regulator transcription factor [Saprospiraceae bacterium]|nr:response regulator transcription factor [Saprospiraceae bacterium]
MKDFKTVGMVQQIKVCLVEDDEEIRQLTKDVLEFKDDIICVETCSSAEDFIDKLPDLNVDIVMMDIGLPGMSGIDCVRKCTENSNKPDFVMYTTHFDSQEVFEALRAGAKGYILKGGSPDRLIQDIYDIAEGGSPMSPQISRLVAESFNEANKRNLELEKLSKQEWEVLKALNKGLNYKEIAAERFVSTHTVRAQIRSIYDKLHVHSKVEAIKKISNIV